MCYVHAELGSSRYGSQFILSSVCLLDNHADDQIHNSMNRFGSVRKTCSLNLQPKA